MLRIVVLLFFIAFSAHAECDTVISNVRLGVTSVSDEGEVAISNFGGWPGKAMLWSASQGMIDISERTGYDLRTAHISPTGFIAGSFFDPYWGREDRAYRLNKNYEFEYLDQLLFFDVLSISEVGADGTVVGTVVDPVMAEQWPAIYRTSVPEDCGGWWGACNLMLVLGDLGTSTNGYAASVNSNGTVAGWDNAGVWLWSEAGGQEYILPPQYRPVSLNNRGDLLLVSYQSGQQGFYKRSGLDGRLSSPVIGDSIPDDARIFPNAQLLTDGSVLGRWRRPDNGPGGAFLWVGEKLSNLQLNHPQTGERLQNFDIRSSANGKFIVASDWRVGTFLFEVDLSVRDSDADGILDDSDNCLDAPNPDQADQDGDNVGDACDTDVDGDSVDNGLDNCPLVANSDQLDVDGDLIGDACDDLIDNDADGIANDLDNCPAVPNADQADNDGDLQGDACDLDDDNDGIEDTVDNCSLTANEDQADNDSDNIGDVCDSDDDNDAIEDDLDNCPLLANVSQDDNDGDGFGDVCDPDDDNDAVSDSLDNCPLSFNPDQSNTDGIGAGDACNDAFDVDDDDWENDYDNCPDVANRNQSDYDSDNIGDACDTDVDGDSVTNAIDACELTPLGNLVGTIGCSIEQLCPCDAPRQSTQPWKNHGQYVSCMTKAARSFAADGVISDNEKSDLVNAAAQSSCGF